MQQVERSCRYGATKKVRSRVERTLKNQIVLQLIYGSGIEARAPSAVINPAPVASSSQQTSPTTPVGSVTSRQPAGNGMAAFVSAVSMYN